MKSTRRRVPFKLIHTEEFSSRSEAMARKKILKSGKGRQIREELVKQICKK
ncbi:hypothetical protein S225a_09110 [Candidatus Brocadiaceae bacterium S225]|nr:hypothetical protein S225a_09110 [Candidatus Brocadiaceae bacterium S225]